MTITRESWNALPLPRRHPFAISGTVAIQALTEILPKIAGNHRTRHRLLEKLREDRIAVRKGAVPFMATYKLLVRTFGTGETAATVDFNAPHDRIAIARSERLAGGFPFELRNVARLVHRR